MKLKTELSTLDKVKKLINVEIQAAQVTIGDGEATLEAEVFEAGEPVYVVNGDERIPLPVGEYKLDSGEVLVVTEEGIIAEIRTEETAEEPAEEEVAANDKPQEQPLPKAVIESVVKETKFSADEITELKAEIETLKTELAALKPVEKTEEEVVELSEEVELTKPITPNPEAAVTPKMNFRYGTNKPMNYLDKIIARTSN